MCSEAITVQVSGDAGDDYEAVVSKAMALAAEFLPGTPIRREPGHCETAEEDWYVGCVQANPSPGGTTLAAVVRIVRFEGRPD